MSQQQQQDGDATEGPEIVSEFPAPPAFFALYRDGAHCGPPPPEPMAPTYHMFGTPYSTQDVVPDLLPQPGRKLYLHGATADGANDQASAPSSSDSGGEGAGSSAAAAASAVADNSSSNSKVATDASALDDSRIDYKAQMKKINRSLLANFVELVDVLIKRPSMFNEKLDDMEQLFLNMHNLINAFRPHQARETILQMLETQIQERRDAAQDIRKTIDAARRAVETAHSELHEAPDDAMRGPNLGDNKTDSSDAHVHAHALANGLLSPSSAPTEQSARAREARLLQENFFDALDAALAS